MTTLENVYRENVKLTIIENSKIKYGKLQVLYGTSFCFGKYFRDTKPHEFKHNSDLLNQRNGIKCSTVK